MGDVGLYNVVVMGVAFLCMFGAFQTSTFIEATVLECVFKDAGDRIAFTSVSIIYFVFAFANSFAPAIVSFLGSRVGMFCGAIPYCLFVGCIIYPIVPVIYACSFFLGIGAAVLWTAQGEFLTVNSNEQTMGRNTGIFWALLQSSLVIGNGAVYFIMGDADQIDNSLRYKLYGILTASCTLGALILLILRKAPESMKKDYTLSLSSSGHQAPPRPSPIQAIISMLKLLKTKEMLLLAVCFSYTGFELTFFSGIYGTMIGNMADPTNTTAMPTVLLSDYTNGQFKKNQVVLAGVCVGAGEILGGLLFGILGKRTIKYGRDPIVLAGLIIHLATFYVIYLNMLPRTPFGGVGFLDLLHDRNRLWNPSVAVALVCAFTLGFGDSLFNTQVYGIIAALYSEDSAPAYSLFKFFQSFFSGIAFLYSSYLILEYQLIILVVTAFLGTACFIKVEWSLQAGRHGYEPIQ